MLNFAITLSLLAATAFFCLVLYRLAGYLQNLPGGKPRYVTRVAPAPVNDDQGNPRTIPEDSHVCENCRTVYAGNMCPKCGNVVAKPPRKFVAFSTVKNKMRG